MTNKPPIKGMDDIEENWLESIEPNDSSLNLTSIIKDMVPILEMALIVCEDDRIVKRLNDAIEKCTKALKV